MTQYRDVHHIVQRLVAEGVRPSRKRVRRELGDQGSNQTIGTMIDQAMRELGLPPREGATPDRDDTPEPRRSDPGEVALLEALAQLPAMVAAVQALQAGLELGARWLYRQRLSRMDFSGMTEVQRILNTPESYGGHVGQLRAQGTAFLTVVERLHRVLQREYAGLQAEYGRGDDRSPS